MYVPLDYNHQSRHYARESYWRDDLYSGGRKSLPAFWLAVDASEFFSEGVQAVSADERSKAVESPTKNDERFAPCARPFCDV